jgi:hypothetical protein
LRMMSNSSYKTDRFLVNDGMTVQWLCLPIHDEVCKWIVPASHVHNIARTSTNPHNDSITSEYVVNAAEKWIGSQTAVPLEENTKLINMSSFMQGDNTVMNVRLHSCTIQKALRNGKVFPTARVIRAPCQHGDPTRFTPGWRIQPTPQLEFSSLYSGQYKSKEVRL